MIYWNLSGKCGFERNERWYDNVLSKVLENKDYFSVRGTNHARRSDLMSLKR